ncbi:DUF6541 family protein [Arthrobacter sp. TB 26]|uniref:DUF6541 family protein n=1 Tax=Arthrobacter sp. TB 26 TaxID=494420 RepID=UPI0004091041|nr:DUF6541 family protein [Arthrobacter sp. TB 26]
MSWWSVVPEFIMAVVILFGPGLLIGVSAGLRRFALVALAPGFSVTVIAGTAVLADFVGIPWSLGPVVLGTFVCVVGVFLTCRGWRGIRPLGFRRRAAEVRLRPVGWRGTLLVTAAVVLAAVTVGSRLIGAFGEPEAFSQTFDNVFHLNAIRYILETGSGSALTVGAMTGGGFYPTAWHDLVSLAVQLTDVPIPVAVNLVNVCIGALVWPLSCIFLARVVVGPTLAATWVAAVLSAAFGAFPLLMVDFGVLYPNFLGISILPAALALGLQAMGLGTAQGEGRALSLISLVLTLPGLALAHPSSIMALLVFLAPAALCRWWLSLRETVRRRGVCLGSVGIHALVLSGSAFAAVVLWMTVRPPKEAAFWPAVESPYRAVFEVITSSAIDRPVSWAVMILALAGLVHLVRKPGMWWLLGVYGVAGLLFVVAASFRSGRIRDFVTGIWYNDPPRLAALLPVAILPVAVVGAVELWKWGKRRALRTARQWPSGRRRLVLQAGGAGLLALLLVTTQQGNVDAAQTAAARMYRVEASSPLVSSDELALLGRLDSHVPPGAVIVGNPWNGSSLAYALADRKALQLHILGAIPPGTQLLYDRLRDATTDPAVCEAVRELNVGYVLDFGHHEVNFGDERRDVFTGLDDLVGSGAAELIDSQGTARLLRITACG